MKLDGCVFKSIATLSILLACFGCATPPAGTVVLDRGESLPGIQHRESSRLDRLRAGMSLEEFRSVFPESKRGGMTVEFVAYELVDIQKYVTRGDMTRQNLIWGFGSPTARSSRQVLWFYFHEEKLVKWDAPNRWPHPAEMTAYYKTTQRAAPTQQVTGNQELPPTDSQSPIAPSSPSGKRVALVIGNGAYHSLARLKNPTNDARSIAATLRTLGFDVTTVEDANRTNLGKAIIDHASRLRDADSGVLFFAGHGVQVRGTNYIMPTDANPRSEGEVELGSVSLPWIMQQVADSGSRTNILILDACRNNPMQTAFRTSARGLAVIGRAPSNMLVLYATSPDDVAADGDGPNGLFTSELLRHIGQPGVPIEVMFKSVVSGVRQKSGGRQIPWMTGSLESHFAFRSD